jgi:hypothetical protein
MIWVINTWLGLIDIVWICKGGGKSEISTYKDGFEEAQATFNDDLCSNEFSNNGVKSSDFQIEKRPDAINELLDECKKDKRLVDYNL